MMFVGRVLGHSVNSSLLGPFLKTILAIFMAQLRLRHMFPRLALVEPVFGHPGGRAAQGFSSGLRPGQNRLATHTSTRSDRRRGRRLPGTGRRGRAGRRDRRSSDVGRHRPLAVHVYWNDERHAAGGEAHVRIPFRLGRAKLLAARPRPVGLVETDLRITWARVPRIGPRKILLALLGRRKSKPNGYCCWSASITFASRLAAQTLSIMSPNWSSVSVPSLGSSLVDW